MHENRVNWRQQKSEIFRVISEKISAVKRGIDRAVAQVPHGIGAKREVPVVVGQVCEFIPEQGYPGQTENRT